MLKTPDGQPHLAPFIRLLVDLHRLVTAGKGDEAHADGLRDEMDVHWYRMSGHEKELSDVLALDLYRFDEEPVRADIGAPRLLADIALLKAAGLGDAPEAAVARQALDEACWRLGESEKARMTGLATDLDLLVALPRDGQPTQDGINQALCKATNAVDWDDALASLREEQADVGPAELATLRGICWANVGYYEVASWFLGNASERMPDDVVVKGLYLRSLMRAGSFDDAKAEAVYLANSSADPYRLLLAADALMQCISHAAENSPPGDDLKTVVELVSRVPVEALPDPPDALQWQLASSGYLSAASAYRLLGDKTRAEESRRAAQLTHARAEQAKIESCQQFLSGFDAALRQERAAIDVNLMTIVPNFVLH